MSWKAVGNSCNDASWLPSWNVPFLCRKPARRLLYFSPAARSIHVAFQSYVTFLILSNGLAQIVQRTDESGTLDTRESTTDRRRMLQGEVM
ncbi:unnamed protein product [Onchocerca flexuosa]|uniref:Uncharacterized protein n=1 Tax=Onchocerca flexuosa TaxID=387005 RepID=A0A183H1A0_9BILA|nr:unnamed protein product [Onchocerca flexuosa]